MIDKYPYLIGILILLMSSNIAVYGQELNGLGNDSTLYNATSNASLDISANATTQNSTSENITNPDNTSEVQTLNNESLVDAASNDNTIKQTAKDLSRGNDKTFDAVQISEIAGAAPEVAAGASSAQASIRMDNAYKLGSVIGGVDPFNPTHKDIESLKLGLPIKPIRDTGKMFFVCDII